MICDNAAYHKSKDMRTFWMTIGFRFLTICPYELLTKPDWEDN